MTQEAVTAAESAYRAAVERLAMAPADEVREAVYCVIDRYADLSIARAYAFWDSQQRLNAEVNSALKKALEGDPELLARWATIQARHTAVISESKAPLLAHSKDV